MSRFTVQEIGLTSLVCQTYVPKTGEMCAYDILPSNGDFQKLKKNLSILVARTITDNLTFFSDDFKDLIHRHTPI